MSKAFDVCIVGGCGHVGLPLGMAFADNGQKVVLYDINETVIEKVNNSVVPFKENNAEEVLKRVIKSKKLFATNNPKVVADSEIVILVIGTPVDEYLNPKLREVINAVKEIEDYLVDGQLLILRSTLYPGVSEKIDHYLKSTGKKIDVAFCPERITEGEALTELYELPQIVGGCNEEAELRATQLFGILTKKIIPLEPKEAELAKLYTNTWRYINFAISNQFFTIANSHELDFYKIYNAMTEDYPRLKAFSKAGFAAGPCLFKDTMQLSAFSGNNFFLGHAAMLVNEGLPDYVVDRLMLNDTLEDKTVGILGMAFKANNDDPRTSLSYKLKKKLELYAKEVLCTDVYIQDPRFVSVEEVKQKADVIILATPHKEYNDLTFGDKKVVDIWNLYGNGSLID